MSEYKPEPIPVPTTGQVVECQVCHNQMLIPDHYIRWEGHPGFKHMQGHPMCRPT